MTNIKKNFFANAASRQLSEFEEKKMKELVEIYQGKIGMYYLVPAGFDFEDKENAYWTSEPSLKAAMTSEEFQDFMRYKVYLQKKKGVSFSLADSVMRKIVSHDFVEAETDLYVFETIRNEIRKICSNLQETVFECETIEPESFEKTLSEYYFKNFKKPVARAVDYYKRQCLKSPEELQKRFVRFLSRSFFAEDADSKEKEAFIMELSKTDKKLQRCFKSISSPELRNMWAYESTTYFSFEELELSEESPEVRKEFQILISEIQMELDGFREWKDKKKKAEKRKVLQRWADILLQKGYVLAEDTIDKIVNSTMPADRTEIFESLVNLVEDLIPSDRKKKIEDWVNEFNSATFRTGYQKIEDVHTILARDTERRRAEEKKQAEEEKLKKKQKEAAEMMLIPSRHGGKGENLWMDVKTSSIEHNITRKICGNNGLSDYTHCIANLNVLPLTVNNSKEAKGTFTEKMCYIEIAKWFNQDEMNEIVPLLKDIDSGCDTLSLNEIEEKFKEACKKRAEFLAPFYCTGF